MQPQDPADSVEKRPLAPVYQLNDLIVDTGRISVTRNGLELPLPKLSFDLLVALIKAAPGVASQDELMDRVWPGLVVGPETVSQRIKLLRDSLGDDPKMPRYVAGVRGRGYRLLPAVVRRDPEGRATAAASAAAVDSGPRWQLILSLLTLGIVVAAAFWLFLDGGRNGLPAEVTLSDAPLPARSVAVLAFENRGGAPGTDILAEGIPETVLHQLAQFPGLTVIARGSSFAFREHPEDLRVIGRRLDVRYLLEGSVQNAGAHLRVTSSLVDAQSGASVWSMQFDRAPSDVFAVQDEIAIEVARAMQLTLDAGTDSIASLRHGVTQSYDAYFAFLRGRALLANLRVADLPAAIESLSAAIRQDPDFASAYVLLARARVALAEQRSAVEPKENFQQALESAFGLLNKAIALDPKSGEAYVERGHLKEFSGEYSSLAAADADLRKGLELSPNYSRGYEVLASVLFQSVARRREALEMIEKARRLDPLAPQLDVLKATYLLWGPGDIKQAVQVLEGVLERDPLYVPAIVRLADVRWCGEGAHADSIQLLEQAVKLDPGNEAAWRQLATIYSDLGEVNAAESALGQAAVDPLYREFARAYFRQEWRKAGESAYRMIATNPTQPQSEALISLALRQHARATGEYRRASEALEKFASVSWDGDEPELQGQTAMGNGVAGLAEILIATGHKTKAFALLEELLADTQVQVSRYGRGEVWVNPPRAMALAMLGRPDEAVQVLQRQVRLNFGKHSWPTLFEFDPAFDSLRDRKDFQALLAEVRANADRQGERLQQMRADGLVPDRS